mgnify:CR=1 FL=1
MSNYSESHFLRLQDYIADGSKGELTDEERRQQSERESMLVVNEWAKDYFYNILSNDIDGQAIGKQYFRSRGIRDDIIKKFHLGYAPQKRDALALAAQKAAGSSSSPRSKAGAACSAKTTISPNC